jgi:hypothetical protein
LIFERDALELDAATTRRRDDATRDDDDATTTIATDRIDRASRGVARAASNARLPSIDSMPARRGDRPNATDDAIDIDGAFDRRRNRNRPRAPRSIGAIEPRRVDRTIVESRDRPIWIAVRADVTPGGTARRTTP